MLDTLMFLRIVGISINLPTFPSFPFVSLLYVMALIFLVFGIFAFIIYLRQANIQGNGASFQQPRRLGTIFSMGVLVLPLLGFLIVGANFLPSFPSIPFLSSANQVTVIPNIPNSNPPSSQVTPPNDLVTKGTLTVGSTLTYPPQDFLDNKGKPAGFDIDLIIAIAKQMGLKVKVKNENFNALVSDLMHHKLDVVISALPINATSQAEFVSYLQSIESYLVLKDGPNSGALLSINDLCGQKVGVLSGSSTIQDLNNANSQPCLPKPITLIERPDTNSIVQLLLKKQIDIAYLDKPVSTYYMQQYSKQLSVVGSVYENVQEGIAVRQGDDAMKQAVTQALQALQHDGTYNRLLKTQPWDFSSEAYTVQ